MTSHTQYNVELITTKEGGRWMPMPVVLTQEHLELAEKNKYKTSAAGILTKTPPIPVPFHSFRLTTGREWDCNNGWRTA